MIKILLTHTILNQALEEVFKGITRHFSTSTLSTTDKLQKLYPRATIELVDGPVDIYLIYDDGICYTVTKQFIEYYIDVDNGKAIKSTLASALFFQKNI